MDPQVEESAKESPVPDGALYGRPSTTRISPGNLGLSIGVLIVAVILAVVLLMVAF